MCHPHSSVQLSMNFLLHSVTEMSVIMWSLLHTRQLAMNLGGPVYLCLQKTNHITDIKAEMFTWSLLVHKWINGLWIDIYRASTLLVVIWNVPCQCDKVVYLYQPVRCWFRKCQHINIHFKTHINSNMHLSCFWLSFLRNCSLPQFQFLQVSRRKICKLPIREKIFHVSVTHTGFFLSFIMSLVSLLNWWHDHFILS